MILVTVGTHHQPFDRLVIAADELAGMTDEVVVVQSGNSSIIPRNARCFRFTSSQEMEELIGQARVVITQAGAGTIIQCLQAHKPLVVIPRQKVYREVFDDHQRQLAVALSEAHRAVGLYELTGNSLLHAVHQASQNDPPENSSTGLVSALRSLLSRWEK
jgi:UDP-N-acetylglucosamine transferase subunit ALG13